jgi:AraC family 4-hydroxyphenylacetate 3-monooxygenase operon regulatory protein
MKVTPPKFRTQDRTYIADRCADLVKAQKANKLQLHALVRSGYPGNPMGDKELPGVLSVGFWDAAKEQEWGLPKHCNEGIEITYLETGSVAFSVDNTEYPLKSGKLTVTRPWQPHALGNPNIGPGRFHWVILDVGVRQPHQQWQWPDWFVMAQKDIKLLTKLLSQNETHVWQANPDTASCFTEIAKTIQNKQDKFQISRLAVLINQLFLSLLNMLDGKDTVLIPELTSPRRTVEFFLDDLKDDMLLLHKAWTTVEMSQECSIGATHFTGLCKKITNMTPKQYLNYHRINSASKMLLEQKNLNITEIAFNCGFTSSQYFATVFKEFKGCSPMEFRKGVSDSNHKV